VCVLSAQRSSTEHGDEDIYQPSIEKPLYKGQDFHCFIVFFNLRFAFYFQFRGLIPLNGKKKRSSSKPVEEPAELEGESRALALRKKQVADKLARLAVLKQKTPAYIRAVLAKSQQAIAKLKANKEVVVSCCLSLLPPSSFRNPHPCVPCRTHRMLWMRR
jgi:hypothetical protein